MPVEERKLTRDHVVEELRKFELRFHMPSAEFEMAFRNGRLHETPEFHRWAYFYALLGAFDRPGRD